MSKPKKGQQTMAETPERVIRSRIRRLYDWEDIKSFFSRLLGMAALMTILFGWLFGIIPMKNNDMSPRISSGDLLLYYRLEKNLRPQDVVVLEKDGKQYVGRIVATSDDTVEITETSNLKVNGSTMIEADIFYPTPIYGDEIKYPLELSENQYFILGDYRDGAKDSRYFGAVDQNAIKGKVLAVIRRSSL